MDQRAPYALDVNIFKMQYIAIIGSVVLLVFILNLIRRKRIKEEYSLLWLFLSFVFILFSSWRVRHALHVFGKDSEGIEHLSSG